MPKESNQNDQPSQSTQASDEGSPTNEEGSGEYSWLSFFVNEFQKESDRASVILASAMLDEALKEFLEAYLVPCSSSDDPLFDGPNAPISTFSSRIESAYRLGLITHSFAKCLHIIRKIRNSFAHDVAGCSFSAMSIISKIDSLVATTRVHDDERTHKNAKRGDRRGCFCYLTGYLMWQIKLRTRELVPISNSSAICCTFDKVGAGS